MCAWLARYNILNARIELMSNLISRSFAALIACLVAAPAFAQISTSTKIPDVDILSSTDETFPNNGFVLSRIFDEQRNSNHARGDFFSLGEAVGTQWEITEIAIQKITPQTFASDTLSIRFFEGVEADFATGEGHIQSLDGDNYLFGTTATEVPNSAESFTLDGEFSNGEYVMLTLSTPLLLDENSDYGFILTYDESTAESEDSFGYSEVLNIADAAGTRISITDEAHIVSESRAIRHFVVGNDPLAPEVEGDYNGNGVVDIADYEVWKVDFGSDDLDADGNGDGVIDAADYTYWRDRYVPPAPALSAVPEPAAVSVLLVGLAGLVAGRRRA